MDDRSRIQAPPGGGARPATAPTDETGGAPGPSAARPAADTRPGRRAAEAVFDQLDTGLVVLDVDGLVVRINPAARRMLGIVAPHPVERPVGELVGTGEIGVAVAGCHAAAADGRPASTDVTADGRTLRVSSAVLDHGAPAPWVVLRIDDVTSHRRADTRAEAILSLVSHELRTPLTVIRGYLDALDRGLFGELSGEIRDAVARMLEQCIELDERIRDLIRFRDLTRPTREAAPVPVDVVARVRLVARALRPAVERARQRLRIDACDRPLPCAARDELVDAVLRHLIDNAVKFAGADRTITLRVQPFDAARLPSGREVVAPTPDAIAAGVHVAVCDDGAGIPAERIDEALRPFTQCEHHLTRRAAGMGLGLPTVVRVVERLGGGMWIDTDAGRGTAVHLLLPRHPATRRSATQPEPREDDRE